MKYPFDRDSKIVTKKYARALIYKFLRRKGVHYAFVQNVKNYIGRDDYRPTDVLDRSINNANYLDECLERIDCSFPWTNDECRGAEFWDNLYTEWRKIVGCNNTIL